MCGFAGFIKNGEKLPKWPLSNMVKEIQHRGPDETGYFQDEYVHLGFKRLSIIDLEKGHQPLRDQSGRYQIIFNGEIYNYLEIRTELMKEGYSFQTESDTEVILLLYMKERERCVQRLRGMFSFVIWDSENKELFGARDPFGIKPFYYMENQEGFAFASELKCLLYCLPEEEKHHSIGLQHYLSFQYIPEPDTAFPSIKKVKPGVYFIKRPEEKIIWKDYWHPSFHPIQQSVRGLSGVIQDELRKSVEMHMRSDVPVGSFLSGGIDSSIIATLAKEFHPRITTYSVGFDEKGYSEMDIAAQTADALGLDHVPYTITAEEFKRELPKIIWNLDDMVADPAAIPLYFLAREASKHVKVALSGEGADELFGGYNIYREPSSLRVFEYIPPFAQKLLRSFASELPEGMRGRSFILRGCSKLSDRFIGNAQIFHQEEKSFLWKTHRKEYSNIDITGDLYKAADTYDDVAKMQYIDMMTWLRGDILVKADRMSMAHSLEVRVPFLDKEIFKIASSLTVSQKISKGTTKHLLREAFRGIVPSHVIDRKKLGFPVPLRIWLKGELYEWAVSILENSEAAGEWFRLSYVRSLLEEHREGKRDNSRKLWTVLVFIIWHDVYEEKRKSLSRKKQLQDIPLPNETEKEA